MFHEEFRRQLDRRQQDSIEDLCLAGAAPLEVRVTRNECPAEARAPCEVSISSKPKPDSPPLRAARPGNNEVQK
jgi:hypothetical protein